LALVKSKKELDCRKLTVITWDEERSEFYKNEKINLVPLWKWLLEKR
jgi:predicted AAA+ superfamily ATPase